MTSLMLLKALDFIFVTYPTRKFGPLQIDAFLKFHKSDSDLVIVLPTAAAKLNLFYFSFWGVNLTLGFIQIIPEKIWFLMVWVSDPMIKLSEKKRKTKDVSLSKLRFDHPNVTVVTCVTSTKNKHYISKSVNWKLFWVSSCIIMELFLLLTSKVKLLKTFY